MTHLIGTFFAPEREARAPWLVSAWIGVLFVSGLVGWSYLIGWGSAALDFHDWTNINLPRLLFLQSALRAGEWPLHMAGGASLHGVTDRFLALPDVITSPQTLLLLWLPVKRFVLVDVLIHYSAGFAGLLLLRRQLQWSLFSLTVVFLMFLFNGHILAHYSVGHFTWGAYFLFPVVAWFLFRFLDGDDSRRSIAMCAAVLFYMVLAGGQHHLTWVLLLMALMVPFCGRRAWWLIAVAAASGSLSAVRLLPPALELSSFRRAGLIGDVIGYPSLMHLVESLIVLRRETAAYGGVPGNIWFFDSAFYEFTTYIGAIGVLILIFGLYRWLREESPPYRQMMVPLLVMTALSLGSVYRVIRATGIPLLEGERYTARMFSLPLFLFTVMAVGAIDRALRRQGVLVWHQCLALVALLFLATDIAASVRLWRVAVSSGLFGATPFDPAASAVAQRADPAYTTIIYEPYAEGWGYSPVYIAVWLGAIFGVTIAIRAAGAQWIPAVIPLLIAITQYVAVVIVYPKGERLILPVHTLLLPYAAIAAHELWARVVAPPAPSGVEGSR